MTALDDTLDNLAGFAWLPGIGQILNGLNTAQQAARNGQLDLEATHTLLSLLGNPNDPDLTAALAHLAQEITNPDTNPALTALDDDTAKTVQLLGELHGHDTADYTPRDHTNEAAGLISTAAHNQPERTAPMGNHAPANSGQCSQCGGRFPDWPGGICDACKTT
ncbi:hypothetical protein ACFC08_28795 [Streptomyces sp. NPDC056112]|uniref:hypothetical protein n=1 Tax=Streptomyces sp. NPDC056112 TaxID=3345715 RepID=UPI0035E1AF9A